MIHLKYPRERGFFTWEELGCLARALGFPSDTFYKTLPPDLQIDEGLSTQDMFDIMEHQKYFHSLVDCTFNMHTDEWNLACVRKSLTLTENKVISFEDLNGIRVAYQVYEGHDTRGLPINERTLLRVIKMCGRMISPMKMMHRIKHMRHQLEDEERLQLFEFFDLLLWCEPYKGIKVTPPSYDLSKDAKNMFNMEDFNRVLTHHDTRLHDKLDADYLKEEWHFAKEKHAVEKDLPKDVPPLNSESRRKRVAEHGKKYRKLNKEIEHAQQRVHYAHAGCVRQRPISAPDLSDFGYQDNMTSSHYSSSVRSPVSRPHTVNELIQPYIRPLTPTITQLDTVNDVPRPQVTQYLRTPLPPTVTTEDKVTAADTIDSLRFEMETIDVKFDTLLSNDLDTMMPGYHKRAKHRTSANYTPEFQSQITRLERATPIVELEPARVRPTTTPSMTEKTPSPTTPTAAVRKSASSASPGPSSPVHAATCDARLRGWQETSTQPGPHFILVRPQFDNSLQGQMFDKMYNKLTTEVDQQPYLYRYTSRQQVASNKTRPTRCAASRTSSGQDGKQSKASSAYKKRSDLEPPKSQIRDEAKFHKQVPVEAVSSKNEKGFEQIVKQDWIRGDVTECPSPSGIKLEPRASRSAAHDAAMAGDDDESEGWRSTREDGRRASGSTEASFRSMDICYSSEVKQLMTRGPDWLTDILCQVDDRKSARTHQAASRIVRRFGGHVSPHLCKRLSASVTQA